ncbi:MAG: DUF6396 domain-containing protein [Pseudomonadota bacterium]
MKSSRLRLAAICLPIIAIFVGAYWLVPYLQERPFHVMPAKLTSFKLTDSLPVCGRWKEHMPATRDAATYRLYIEARKLWRSKIEWQLTRQEATRILTDVSLAAERGDWGALALMAYFYREGLGPLPGNNVLKPDLDKSVAIVRQAAAAGLPWGLFDLGVAYEHGYGGAHYSKEIAWAYYLKAARLGSPEAQLALADAYAQAERRDDEIKMLECAYRQGNGTAAYRLSMKLRAKERYQEAILIHQNGIKFGDARCATSLRILFDDGSWPNAEMKQKQSLSLIGIAADPERAKRYEAISDALEINPDLKLTRLDQVLPLPPAMLPDWNGVGDAVEPEPSGPPTY